MFPPRHFILSINEDVLLPYGFLLEDNIDFKMESLGFVLLPYGFLLEDNMLPRFKGLYGVLLPFIILLEDDL